MKITVCELKNGPEHFDGQWQGLVDHVNDKKSDLVLLPEMPFCPWFATSRLYDAAVWRAAVQAHDEWQTRLSALAPATVFGSRPVGLQGPRRNQGFIWEQGTGYRGIHDKCYLPDEEDFWEARWYARGDGSFQPAMTAGVKVGFLICTEIWFMHQARAYGQAGVHFIATPRATPPSSLQRWLTAGRAAAIIAGAFGLSSNRAVDDRGNGEGQSWVISPEGDILAQTSAEQPVVTVALDLQDAIDAKATYPRYVPEI